MPKFGFRAFILVIAAPSIACGDPLAADPDGITVHGTVRASSGVPAPSQSVELRIWRGSACADPNLPPSGGFVQSVTSALGAYSGVFSAGPATTACIEARVGAVAERRDASGVLGGQRLRIDLQL